MKLTFSLFDCIGQDESSVTPTNLKLTLDWRCHRDNGMTTGFYISLFLDTLHQGRIEMVHDLLMMIGSEPQREIGSVASIEASSSSAVNIDSLSWDLVLFLFETQTPGEYKVRISGKTDPKWIIGEMDLDPRG